MRKPLQDKTVSNSSKMETNTKMNAERNMENIHDKTSNSIKGEKNQSDTSRVIEYLQKTSVSTKDVNLKYDISRCLEIIQGKENIEMIDLKDTLKATLEENENLQKHKIELMCEIEYLNEKLNE